jgi:hypothetical protein
MNVNSNEFILNYFRLSEFFPNKMMAINGFKLVRSDKNDGRRGSGVGLYVKSRLAFKVVAKTTPEQLILITFLWI